MESAKRKGIFVRRTEKNLEVRRAIIVLQMNGKVLGPQKIGYDEKWLHGEVLLIIL